MKFVIYEIIQNSKGNNRSWSKTVLQCYVIKMPSDSSGKHPNYLVAFNRQCVTILPDSGVPMLRVPHGQPNCDTMYG